MSGDETADAIADHDNEVIAAYRESPEYLDDLFERIADDREFERTVSRRWAMWLRQGGHESSNARAVIERVPQWAPRTRSILDAMRSGEWLRTQWIARVAFDLGSTPDPHPEYGTTVRILRLLSDRGIVEHRKTPRLQAHPVGGLLPPGTVPPQTMSEWRLRPPARD